MLLGKRNDISNINWEQYVGGLTKDVIEHDGLAENAHWILPQLMAFLGSKLPITRNESGKFSFRLTSAKIQEFQGTFQNGKECSGKALRGICRFLTYTPRGDILHPKWSQAKDAVRYSAAVPLILSALKEFRDVNYMEWDWTEELTYITRLVDKDNAEFATFLGSDIPWSKAQLLEFRENARLFKTGMRAGTKRSLTATTTITTTKDVDFDALPRLVKVSLCQTWLYTPGIATNLMFTNLKDLDTFPEPLLEQAKILEVDDDWSK
jgi:hypothetical protein